MNKKQNNKFSTSPYGQYTPKAKPNSKPKSNLIQNKLTTLPRRLTQSTNIMLTQKKINRLESLENLKLSERSDRIEIVKLKNQVQEITTQLQKAENDKLLYMEQNRKQQEEIQQLKQIIKQFENQQIESQNRISEIQFDQWKTYSYLLNEMKISYAQALRLFDIPSLEKISFRIQNEIVYSLLTHLNIYKFDATSGALTCNQCSKEPEDDDILLPCHRFHQECLEKIIEKQKNQGNQQFTCTCGQVPITPALLLLFNNKEFAKEISQQMRKT